MEKPIVVTMGDPNGVGPRLAASLCRRSGSGKGLVVIGLPEVMERALAAEDIALPLRAWRPGLPVPTGFLHCLAPEDMPPGTVEPGRISSWAGRAALACVDLATDLCLEGSARAMVTAPLAKEAVDQVAPGFSGHTGHIARRTGAASHCLALVHGSMWAAFVTTHIPLRDVPKAITPEAIVSTGMLLDRALHDAGLASPRIGVAGLNPHAGEHGLFGDEELKVVDPAVAKLRALGVDAQGSLPADVVFPLLKAGKFDGVVSLYHDQGHPVMKTLAFDFRRGKVRGVNVTLGLPIVRTSPDHGTGFDIAWKERADDGSMRDALGLARRMSRRRAPA